MIFNECPTVEEPFDVGIKKKNVLSITSSGEIGFWEHDIEASKCRAAQEGARASAKHTISPYHHGIWRIFIECGKKPHARKSAQGRSARGPILPKSNRNFWQSPFGFVQSNTALFGLWACWQKLQLLISVAVETASHYWTCSHRVIYLRQPDSLHAPDMLSRYCYSV